MRSGILLVEDDAEDQSIFCDAMDSVGGGEPVHTEKNGLDALHYLSALEEHSLPCLIVADLNMPKMNGSELLVKLKENSLLQQLPVVIYTTSINEREKEACLSLGAHDYITKPLTYQQSIDVAEMLVNLCHKQRTGK